MMDDIIIFGESSEEHDARLRAVFLRLEDNGVTLNFEKCEFAKSSITYFGHVVSEGGIKQIRPRCEQYSRCKNPKTLVTSDASSA